MLRDRELAHRGQVGALERVLERDPVGPRVVERAPEDEPELVRVVARAALVAPDPVHHLVGPVGVGEPGHEPRAVQVGVRGELEVRPHPARLETERIVEVRAVADHRAEHHLVVAALRAAEPAAHPGFHEHGAAFDVPPRRREPGDRQVAVEERLGVLGPRLHLAAEEIAPATVFVVREVALRDVHELVVHQRVEPLGRRVGFERVRQRRDVEDQPVARRGTRGGVAVVGEVLEQDGDFLGGLPAEALALRVERVLERAGRVRREVAERLEPDEPEVLRLEERHPERVVVVRHRGRQPRHEQQQSDGEAPHRPSPPVRRTAEA